MSHVFVSDVHLSPARPDGMDRFAAFLEDRVLGPGHRLIVAGDLFDWWYGLPGVVPSDVARIAQLVGRAKGALWLEGNHDVMIGRSFGDHTPIGFSDGCARIEVGSRALHVEHGDLVDPEDRAYRLFRALLRGPPGRAAAAVLGTTVVRALGSRAAGTSRAAQAGGPSPRWLRHARTFARAKAEEGLDFTVLGHGHWLGWWPEGLICLGDWLRHDSYLLVDTRGVPTLMGYRADGDVVLADGPDGTVTRPGPR